MEQKNVKHASDFKKIKLNNNTQKLSDELDSATVEMDGIGSDPNTGNHSNHGSPN